MRILVALDLTHQSGREHLAGFYRYADKKDNWEVRLVPSTEESYLPMIRQFLSDRIDGVIIKGECVPAAKAAIQAANVPTVSIDKPVRDMSAKDTYICNNNENIGCAAAQFFASLGRFAAYGFVPDPNDCEWSQIRGKAFCDSLNAKYPEVSVSVATSPLSEWLSALPKPAALFAAFDQCASTVLDCCRELKIKVPRDVIVLGVDDDALVCEHTRPKLSSIRPDHEGQGFAAARELDKLLSSKKPAKPKTIICSHIGITERDSTAVVPPAVHLVREAKTYIAAHALEGIRVEEVVRHLGVSARLANLRFSQAVGHSIRDELVLRRLNEAKRLLEDTEYPQKRIAQRCGFKSTIILSHLFRTHFGKSMRDWRQDAATRRSVRNDARSQGTSASRTTR